MSERLSQKIAAFREGIVFWRRGVNLEPEAVEVLDELFEGWERAALELERLPAAMSAEDLEALGALTQKLHALAARVRGHAQPQLKAV